MVMITAEVKTGELAEQDRQGLVKLLNGLSSLPASDWENSSGKRANGTSVIGFTATAREFPIEHTLFLGDIAYVYQDFDKNSSPKGNPRLMLIPKTAAKRLYFEGEEITKFYNQVKSLVSRT